MYASICRAQCSEGNPGLTDITIAPQYWAPGQTYTITLTDPNGSFVSYIPQPGLLPATAYAITEAEFNAGNYSYEDPNVTLSLPVLVSSTEIMFTATIAANAPTENNDAFALICAGSKLLGEPGIIQITPCANTPTPVITSVSPSAFFAGESTSVTISGSNFIPQNNPNNCYPTEVSIFTADEELGGGSAISPTEIDALVEPDADETDLSATILVGNYIYYNGGGTISASATASVLPAPAIQWNGNTISTADGSAPTTQNAVIGQTINLTINPSTLPSGTTFTNTWTVAGTNIGGYTVTPPTQANPTQTTATVTSTALTNADLTAYWLATGTKLPVTYQYCVNIAGLTNPCSAQATAKFTVKGPTRVSVTTSDKTFGATYDPPETLDWNIDFNAKATSPSGDAGEYTWVQIVQSVDDIVYFNDGTSQTCTGGPGLDSGPKGEYPYDTGLSTDDAPDDPLNASNQSGANDTDSFQMYLQWNPETDSKSIPVTLGSITWTATGTITFNPSSDTWGEESGNTTAGSLNTTPTEPTWSTGIIGASITCSN